MRQPGTNSGIDVYKRQLLVLPLTVAAAFIEAYVTPVIMALFMG